MTEAEWLTCADPGPMLGWLRGRASARKRRLFACAVARLLPAPPDEAEAREQAEALPHSAGHGWFWPVAQPDTFEAAEYAAVEDQLPGPAGQLAGLVRCLWGDPFRPVAFDPAWRTPAVPALAGAAYAERSGPGGSLDPGRLAVLADALEEVACTDPALLGHLRGPGPHVRGCHVVDTVLGKE